MLLLNKKPNFNKNNTESKIIPHNLVFQLTEEWPIKNKTLMSWSSRKKKECIFCNVCFVRKKWFLKFMLNLNE